MNTNPEDFELTPSPGHDNRVSCEDCDGTGTQPCEDCENGKCELCHGHGEESDVCIDDDCDGIDCDHDGVECDDCGGDGDCLTCHGSQEITCRRCHGDGKMSAYWYTEL